MAIAQNRTKTSNSAKERTVVTDATLRKRDQLVAFVEQKLATQAAVKAVVGVGSIATGHARPWSDIDAAVFMDPLDLHVVPAESIWRPRDDTFHSIFSDEPELEEEGLQFDFHRYDLAVWRDPSFDWPEPLRAELSSGWVAFDRDGEVSQLVAERTAYPDRERMRVLDEALPMIDGHLPEDDEDPFGSLGPVITSDRLQATYEQLVHALFAYNRKWCIWRSREMPALLQLPWLPEGFDEHIMAAAISNGHDQTAYRARVKALRHLFTQLLQRLVADGLYGNDPVSEAFIRAHDEPGRAWNMAEWNQQHSASKKSG